MGRKVCVGLAVTGRLRIHFSPATPFSIAVLVLLSVAGAVGKAAAGAAAGAGSAADGAAGAGVATGAGVAVAGLPTAPAACCAKSPM